MNIYDYGENANQLARHNVKLFSNILEVFFKGK